MEGKLRILSLVSLALALILMLGSGMLTAMPASAGAGQKAFLNAGIESWVVPMDATEITIEAWGAGGAGGGSTNAGPFSARGGGGGGGGAYARSTFTVETGGLIQPGDTIRVVVGAGGVGVSGGNGGRGGDSFVGPSISAANAHVLAGGGLGGKANTAGGSPAGGAGGTGVIREGSQRYVEAGANGEAGGTCFTSCSGGGGRGAYEGGYGGAGFCGAYITSDGNPGDPAGGGGGGSRTSQYNGARAGGKGADGKVVIAWSTEAPQTYTLTLTSTAGGSVTTPPEGAYSHAAGTVINLVATPSAGCWFLYWTATSPGFANATAAETTFTMPAADVTVTAHFQCPGTYVLSMAVAPAGAGTATDETNASPYAAGTVVTIKAVPSQGCAFVNWTAPAGSFANATAAETTFTMPAQNVVVTANFQCETYRLTINSEEGGFVATPGEGESQRAAGTVINLVATPLNGCYFEYWTATAGVFGNPYIAETTFTMPAQDVTIIAHFKCVPVGGYTLTMAVAPAGKGTATDQTGSSPYPAGATVSIKAVPIAGCWFINWTAPAGVFGNPNLAETTFTMPAQHVTVTANFACEGLQCPTISPQVRYYYVESPNPIWTTIYWNNGATSVSVLYGVEDLILGIDYKIEPNNAGTATLTILPAYLASHLSIPWQSIALTIRFGNDHLCDTTFRVTSIGTVPVGVGLAGQPVNKLAVMTPWLLLLTALVAGTGLLALRRRRSLT